MNEDRSNTVLCTFRVVPGREDDMLALLRDHEAVMRELDLVTEEPSRCWRGEDGPDRPFFVKVFTWRSAEAVDAAHKHPDVQRNWEAMEPLCEERDGRPSMEFPHVFPVALS